MKFKLKLLKQPVEGQRRIRKGFLFIPMILDDEFRWLQRAKWEEKYVRMENPPEDEYYFGQSPFYWAPQNWVNY